MSPLPILALSDMPLNKYICHIVHVCFTALPVKSVYRPLITLHISLKKTKKKKKKKTTTLTYHGTAIYVPTLVSLKCHICQLVFMYRYHTTTLYQLTTIKNVTTHTGIHFTLLAYVPEQISLSHHTSMPHCPNNVVYMQIPH